MRCAPHWPRDDDLGGEDPLPVTVDQLMDSFADHVHPQVAVRLTLAVASNLPDSDRQIAARVILEKQIPPPERHAVAPHWPRDGLRKLEKRRVVTGSRNRWSEGLFPHIARSEDRPRSNS